MVRTGIDKAYQDTAETEGRDCILGFFVSLRCTSQSFAQQNGAGGTPQQVERLPGRTGIAGRCPEL
jgi:hypothetical protein